MLATDSAQARLLLLGLAPVADALYPVFSTKTPAMITTNQPTILTLTWYSSPPPNIQYIPSTVDLSSAYNGTFVYSISISQPEVIQNIGVYSYPTVLEPSITLPHVNNLTDTLTLGICLIDSSNVYTECITPPTVNITIPGNASVITPSPLASTNTPTASSTLALNSTQSPASSSDSPSDTSLPSPSNLPSPDATPPVNLTPIMWVIIGAVLLLCLTICVVGYAIFGHRKQIKVAQPTIAEPAANLDTPSGSPNTASSEKALYSLGFNNTESNPLPEYTPALNSECDFVQPERAALGRSRTGSTSTGQFDQMYRVKTPRKRQNEDELNLEAGDLLVVTEIFEDGWAIARNQNGDMGAVPLNFLEAGHI
ncbi:uncharacterized protein BJ171DRAFT_626336 [Polychytrium aggregatum]|uniref:uncharacterized protein n=1 Tax=Polychytrium aggregatum TaxID=110093 RepID=UPI0022FF287F|nr:uncharacterized protein BJ171DRAFT_626336 [Polychytrium aggregatum]KAI9202666.1 hypothetical protein BJ171DRAFT_626336 [Polychytrium aggregatum]